MFRQKKPREAFYLLGGRVGRGSNNTATLPIGDHWKEKTGQREFCKQWTPSWLRVSGTSSGCTETTRDGLKGQPRGGPWWRWVLRVDIVIHEQPLWPLHGLPSWGLLTTDRKHFKVNQMFFNSDTGRQRGVKTTLDQKCPLELRMLGQPTQTWTIWEVHFKRKNDLLVTRLSGGDNSFVQCGYWGGAELATPKMPLGDINYFKQNIF